MKSNKFYISILILFLSVFSVFGQTRKQLEAQRKKLNKEIKQVNTLLFNEIKKEKNAVDALKDIFQKIEVRTQLISTIHLEAAILSKEITANQMKLTKLSDKLVRLKKDYAAMIFNSYKSRSQESRTMFLLSSQSFLQAYKRLGYMKQYTSFRKKQGEEISIEKEQEILKSIQEKYEAQTSPYYAAARLWTDAIINPLDTRKWISMGIEAANHAPIEKQFNLGVIQV